MASGNATNGRTLKRMELQYKDIDIKFAVNPTDFTQTKPNRATITQTKGGAWIDAWGAGIIEFTIKGITGVKGGTNSIDTGYERWKKLESLFDSLYAAITDGQEVKDYIAFYNHTDNIYYYCYPTQSGIELYRSASKPHAYQYTIHLWGIRKIGQPAQSSGTIGNPNKTSGGDSSVTSTNQTASGGGTAHAAPYAMRRARARDVEVDQTILTTNTKTKTVMDIQNDCYEYLTTLEPLVGGKSGKISPVTGYNCTQGITMQSSGTISNVTGFSGKDLSDEENILLVETMFTSKVSIETYELLTQIRDYSPEVLCPEYSLVVGITPRQRVIQAVGNSKQYDCTLYELIAQYLPKFIITKAEANRIKIVLLESMMVYQKLWDLYNQSLDEPLATSLTSTGINILIRNIQALIMYFTFNSIDTNRSERQNISAELRKLEKVMTQIQIDIVDYL